MIPHYYFNDDFHILLMLNTLLFKIRGMYMINTAFLVLIRDVGVYLLNLDYRNSPSFSQTLHALSCYCLHSHVSLTGVLSEATHISRHAHGSKWDATLLGLLDRERSRLLSLTLRCPAVSSPQITEDDNYVLAEEPIFACAATSVHDTHSQVGRADTSKAQHSKTCPYKSGAVFSPFIDVGCVWLIVCQLQIPLDCHSQMVGETATISFECGGLRFGLMLLMSLIT